MARNYLVDSFLPQSEKCGNKRVKEDCMVVDKSNLTIINGH